MSLLVFVPLFASVYLRICAAGGQEPETVRLSVFPVYWAVWVGFANLVVCELLNDSSVYRYEVVHVYRFFTWSSLLGGDVTLSVWVDNITLLMCFVVFTIWIHVDMFVPYYMGLDRGIERFYSYLALFTFCMLLMVTSEDLVQFFIGWEAVGLCSYLLINFWYTRQQANKSALKAILLNRVGDYALMCAIIICFVDFGSFNIYDLTAVAVTQGPVEWFSIYGVEITNVDFIGFCFFIAAMSKSAQFGLHTWLPDAMEGPTPVSALIHAATMVTAGIYLLVRMAGFLVLSPGLLTFISVIGALTALFGATTALAQSDIKKVIAFSTCSQLGYMVMACGSAHFSLAFFHLLTHAFFKALLFLCAGVIIHTMGGEQDLRRMGGLRRQLPIVYVAMSIASAALAGIPYLSGYYSKDLIIGVLWFQNTWLGFFCGTIAIVSAFCTSIYSASLSHHAFMGVPKWSANRAGIMYSVAVPCFSSHAPLVSLSFFSVFAGYFLKDALVAPDLGIFPGVFAEFVTIPNLILRAEFAPVWFKFLTLFAGFSGFIYYAIVRVGQSVFAYHPGVSLIKTYKFLFYRWCVDLIYSFYFVGCYMRVSHLWQYLTIQQQVLDKWCLDIFTRCTRQGATLVIQSHGINPKTYFKCFVLGLVVYSFAWLVLIEPIDALYQMHLMELQLKAR